MSESKECSLTSAKRKSVHFPPPQSYLVHEVQPPTLATRPSDSSSPDASFQSESSVSSTISTLLPAFQSSTPKRGRCRCQNAPWITPPPSGRLGLMISVVEQEILLVFPAHQSTSTEILRLSSTVPLINNRAWDLCQVVISSRPVSVSIDRTTAPLTSEKLLGGKFATGAFRAYQSVLRLLTLLTDDVAMEGEAGRGMQVLGPRSFAVNGGVEEICTICARIVLRVPRSLSEDMFQGLLVGFE